MPPTWKTIAATWLSPGHPGPLRFHMGCRQHLLLAKKIAEDKRQAPSTSWQIRICEQAFLICRQEFLLVNRLTRGDFLGELCFISEEITLKPFLDITLMSLKI